MQTPYITVFPIGLHVHMLYTRYVQYTYMYKLTIDNFFSRSNNEEKIKVLSTLAVMA